METQFESVIRKLLACRALVLAAGAFLGLSFPDVWRQVLCLTVSQRYWSRWAIEKSGLAVDHPFLPAVLDSGDFQGVMPMEFPLLYVLTAPFYALGPYWGRALSVLAIVGLVFVVTLLNARTWRGKKIVGVDAFGAMLLLPISSVCLTWAGKYMPDFISVLLVTWAVGLSWDRDRYARSFLLAALGMLLKPTSIVVLLLFFAQASGLRGAGEWKKLGAKALRTMVWSIPAAAISYAYYTAGVRYLEGFKDLPTAVGLYGRSMLHGVLEFCAHLPFVAEYYLKTGFFLGGVFVVLGISIWHARVRGGRFPLALWLLSLAQFFAVTAIDGGALFYDHPYYLMVLGPVQCLLFADAMKKAESRWWRALLILGLVIPMAEASLRELKPYYRRPMSPTWTQDRQARELKDRNPSLPWGKGVAFRSLPQPDASIGMYFGEIIGSKSARYGLFFREEPLPSSCTALDQSELFVVGECR